MTNQVRPRSLDTTGLVSGKAEFPAKLRAGIWSPGEGTQYKLINEELLMFFPLVSYNLHRKENLKLSEYFKVV